MANAAGVVLTMSPHGGRVQGRALPLVLAAVVVATSVGAPSALRIGQRQVDAGELGGIVVPESAPTFSATGAPTVERSIDGTAVAAATVEAQAAADIRQPPPLPLPPDHQPLRPAVAPFDFPDPWVLAANGRYYAFATNAGGRNVQVSVSDDVFTWATPGDALPTLPLWSRPGQAWAPAVAAIGGRYVLYVSLPVAADDTQCIDRFVADDPAGPYAPVGDVPLLCNTVGGSGVIDPSPFVADGRVFLYWKSAGSRGAELYVTELSADGLQTTGDPHGLLGTSGGWEGGGIENPVMVRAAGGDMLFYSANWWTDSRYSMGWARCDGPLGPCTKGGGPWLASRDGVSGPGGGSFFTDGGGQQWVAFHAWGGGVGYGRGGQRQLHLEPVDLSGRAPAFVDRAPTGSLDAVQRVPGGVLVAGSAHDADTARPVDVEVRVNGWPLGGVAADGRRYASVVALAPGHHTVCVNADDDVGMSMPELGCAAIDVVDTASGAVELAGQGGAPGTLQAAGWALDPDTDAPVPVDVYVDRVLAQSLLAAGDRPDVGAAHPGYSAAHGWAIEVAVAPGQHDLCAYAADDGTEPSTNLGCVLVTVT